MWAWRVNTPDPAMPGAECKLRVTAATQITSSKEIIALGQKPSPKSFHEKACDNPADLWSLVKQLQARTMTAFSCAPTPWRQDPESFRRRRVAPGASGILCSSLLGQAALLSAGSVLSATERVCAGEVQSAFCVVRPPGRPKHSFAASDLGWPVPSPQATMRSATRHAASASLATWGWPPPWQGSEAHSW